MSSSLSSVNPDGMLPLSIAIDDFGEIKDERGKVLWRNSCLPTERSQAYFTALWVRLKLYFVNIVQSPRVPEKHDIFYFFAMYGGSQPINKSMIKIDHFYNFWICEPLFSIFFFCIFSFFPSFFFQFFFVSNTFY